MVFILNCKRRITYPGVKGGPGAVHNNKENDDNNSNNHNDNSMVTQTRRSTRFNGRCGLKMSLTDSLLWHPRRLCAQSHRPDLRRWCAWGQTVPIPDWTARTHLRSPALCTETRSAGKQNRSRYERSVLNADKTKHHTSTKQNKNKKATSTSSEINEIYLVYSGHTQNSAKVSLTNWLCVHF